MKRITLRLRAKKTLLAVMAIMTVVGLVGHFGQSHALAKAGFLRLDNPVASAFSSSRVCFTPSSNYSVKTIVVTFPTVTPTDYTVSSTAANWTITTTNMDSGQTALTNLPATGTPSGKTVTVTLSAATAVTTANLYCFNFSNTTSALQIGSACAGGTSCEATQGTIVTKDNSAVTMDTTIYSVTSVSSGSPAGNQVAITGATVPPIFNFSLSGNTDAFTTNLSLTSVVSTSGRNIVISTNAANGWIIWAQNTWDGGSGKGALKSATTGTFITGSAAVGTAARNINSSIGSEDYGMSVTSVGCSGTANAAYNATVTATNVGTLNPAFYSPIATGAAGSSCTTTQLERATISATTKAANDYADTISFVGAGSF